MVLDYLKAYIELDAKVLYNFTNNGQSYTELYCICCMIINIPIFIPYATIYFDASKWETGLWR